MHASPYLSAESRRILRAASDVIRPRGHGFDHAIDDDVLAEVDAFLPHLPPPMRRAFPLGLRALEWGPPFVIRRGARFSRLPPDEARRYLERALALGGPLGAMVLGVRTLILLCFYQHPAVLRTLEVDWETRARERTARRAALLAE
jgi:hypothetical protein